MLIPIVRANDCLPPVVHLLKRDLTITGACTTFQRPELQSRASHLKVCCNCEVAKLLSVGPSRRVLSVICATTTDHGPRSTKGRGKMPVDVLSKQYRFILVSDLDWTMVSRFPRMLGAFRSEILVAM